MILVNISRSGIAAVTPQQIRDAAVRAWKVKEESLNRFGDLLVAVRSNVVVGVWKIDGWIREESGRYAFQVSDTQDQSMIGGPSPVPWITGQANPVKYVDTTTATDQADVETTADGHRSVKLEGWTLVVLGGGRAQLHGPTEPAGQLIVENAGGGNVTVRLISA